MLFIMQFCNGCKSGTRFFQSDTNDLASRLVMKLKASQQFQIDKSGYLEVNDIKTHKPQRIVYAVNQTPSNPKGIIAIINTNFNITDQILYLQGMIDIKVLPLHSLNANCLVATVFNGYGPGYLKSELIIYVINKDRLIKCLELSGDEHSEQELYTIETEIMPDTSGTTDISYIASKFVYNSLQDFGLTNVISSRTNRIDFKYNSSIGSFVKTNINCNF